MKNPFIFLLFCLLLRTLPGQAQRPFFQQGSIGVQGHYGSFLTQSPKAFYLKDSYSYSGELYYQHQTDGSRAWHRYNNLPQWGVGVFRGHTGSHQYMGSMSGVFSYINLSLIKKGIYNSRMRVAMGFGWVEKPYDKISNHKNVLIGSHGNAYIQFLWQHEFKLAPRTFINAGLNFSHLSNGGSTLPNLGLNIPALSVGLRYGAEVKKEKPVATSITSSNHWTYKTLLSAGIRQSPWIGSKRYVVNTLNLEANRRFRNAHQYGGGVVMYYDRSLEVDPSGITSVKRKNNKLQAGVYAAYEHQFGKLSMPIQLGAYVFNKDLAPTLFQNLGFRFQFTPAVSGQLLMKTHMGQAHHISLGLGYTFNP